MFNISKTKWFLQDHKNELVIVGVMTGISLAIAIAAGIGDLGEVVARRGR